MVMAKQISFSVDDEIKEKFTEIAKKNGKSEYELMQEITKEYVKKHKC